mmetsp:Transcript_50541/g.110296  ORF Transcript_50541/g.110296 Transcript_50541/m.110296 type:complete len:727 (+) Transcript_50541:106-2286(+)
MVQVPKLGIYVASEGQSVAALSQLQGQDAVFMVTQSTSSALWHASLKHTGFDEGKDIWALTGHPDGRVFVQDGNTLAECDTPGLVAVRVWSFRDDLHEQCFNEPCGLPVSKWPSENFQKAVMNKDPRLKEEGSPDTDTIARDRAGHYGGLPQGPIKRQIMLVELYTAETPLYHEMNQALRDDDEVGIKYYAAFIKELRDVFLTDHEYQIIQPFRGTVWRGINVENPETLMKEYKPKKQFVWSAFTSTTKNKGKAFGGTILFEIRCYPPPGTYDDDEWEYAPADINEFSRLPHEDEILFPPNTRFQVARVDPPCEDEDRWVVVCDATAFDTEGTLVSFGADGDRWTRLQAMIDDMGSSVGKLKERTDPVIPKPKVSAEETVAKTDAPEEASTKGSGQMPEQKAPAVASTAPPEAQSVASGDKPKAAAEETAARKDDAQEGASSKGGGEMPLANAPAKASSASLEVLRVASGHEEPCPALRWATSFRDHDGTDAASYTRELTRAQRLHERGARLRGHSLASVKQLQREEMWEAEEFLEACRILEECRASRGPLPDFAPYSGDVFPVREASPSWRSRAAKAAVTELDAAWADRRREVWRPGVACGAGPLPPPRWSPCRSDIRPQRQFPAEASAWPTVSRLPEPGTWPIGPSRADLAPAWPQAWPQGGGGAWPPRDGRELGAFGDLVGGPPPLREPAWPSSSRCWDGVPCGNPARWCRRYDMPPNYYGFY